MPGAEGLIRDYRRSRWESWEVETLNARAGSLSSLVSHGGPLKVSGWWH